MIEALRELCRRLLAEERVQVVIGYGQSSPEGPVHPQFVTRPEEVEQLVWNDRCFANLTAYLTRRDVRALGTAAVLVKGCDERALTVLEQESQLEREKVFVVGMACTGMGDPPLEKCRVCDRQMPRLADETLGEAAEQQHSADERYAALEAFLERPTAARMAYWQAELARCVKCYACRQVCPLCYCERCIVDKNRPAVLDTSATLKGNFAWHVTRAFHLAARCVGCGECARVCPVGIDLTLLNQSLSRAAEEHFDFRAGEDSRAEPIVGSCSPQDREEFIR